MCRTAKWLEAEGETGEGARVENGALSRVAPFMAGIGEFPGICNLVAPCDLSAPCSRGKHAQVPGRLVRKFPKRRSLILGPARALWFLYYTCAEHCCCN